MSCIISTTKTDDEIRCEMALKAPMEKVWAALTTREGWSGWFSDDVETDFQPGSKMKLDFGKYGIVWGTVAEREEMKAFAYKWHPGEGDGTVLPDEEMTTVRFEIEPNQEGTRLVMTEFGFKAIPGGRRLKALEMNTEGWQGELGELVAWVEEDKHQPVTTPA